MDPGVLKHVQAVLSVAEEPPYKTVLSVEELQQTWACGNDDGEARPEFSDAYKLSIIKGQRRWQSFCEFMRFSDWRSALKGISFEDKGLIDSFIRYLVKNDGSKIKTRSTVDQYMRQLYAVYRKYTGQDIDERFYKHVKATIAKYTHLQTEQSEKHFIGPDAFLYLAHFRWVRDNKTVFHIGLDRLDDATLRQLQMFTGARTHEYVLAETADPSTIIQQYYDKDDYYGEDTYTDFSSQQSRICSLCNRPDNRTTAATKVLCWEDIEFWILQDPYENGGRDRLALTIMHRFHKGHKRHSRPTRFIFVEEDLPVICPVSHILAKTIAEGVIKNEKFQRAEQFFQTRLTSRGLKVDWKDEFLHVPVFRRTVKCMEGFTKSNSPLTRYQYDKATKNLGWAAGLSVDLCSYDMRRGLMSAVSDTCIAAIRRQVSRHGSDDVYDNYYINTKVNVVTQDAFLGRTSKSPYLAIFNHTGMHIDENAPTKVTDEMMQLVPPSAEVEELERQTMALHDDKEAYVWNSDFRSDDALPPSLATWTTSCQKKSLVQRKIDAINAWVDYAWKLEIKEKQPVSANPSSTPEAASHTDTPWMDLETRPRS
ncbi:FluG domain-containing protein [Niveomyces insectorum RCEF 264]|uniref:FluG domain-containing protein n=1 Tax=Niveomyces insectorum RCEF 264 TaxID=1081102 RepID=A0A168AA89_9HYPO|nr:FluG domain-containing protein [Niveomyces insectorum RCEF 264]